MKQILTGGRVYTPQGLRSADVLVDNGRIVSIDAGISVSDAAVIPCNGKIIAPGFADVHVHLREPGFSYKETVESGTAAAARGGYTAVCAMPNLLPPPDTVEHLAVQQARIGEGARIKVYPYGCITMGQQGGGTLTDMAALAAAGACAFSDDGRGVQEADTMQAAMERAAAGDLLIAAHCEEESLLNGGYIHDGDYARTHGHRGIASASEWKQVERDLGLAAATGCRYHVCHISAKETVALIRKAKAAGVRVTCETAPHYLALCDEDMQEDGRFKMNPPLRSREDREALLEGIRDGTIDMVATDHAPHSAKEKSKGLAGSAMGVVGLETAFPVLYTTLVLPGLITPERLIELLSVNPRQVFRLGGSLSPGQPADLTVLDPDAVNIVDPERFLSCGRATPFAGLRLQGEITMTMIDGRICFEKGI